MALVGLVCTALGFGLALAFGDTAGPTATPPLAESSDDEGPRRGSGPREASMRRGDAGIAEASAGRVDHNSSVEAAMTGVRRSSVSAVTGTGVIRGVVVDDRGAPISGVTVHAFRGYADSLYGEAADAIDLGNRAPSSLRETLRRSADEWTQREGGHFTARSSSDGTFEIGDLPATSFSLSANLDGFVFRGDDLWQVFPGQSVELTGFAILHVEVEVRLPDGSAPAQAALYVSDEGDENTIRWTPDSTRIPITTREATITAYADIEVDLPFASLSTARYRSDMETVSDHPAGEHIVLELEEHCGVYGWIHVPEGSMCARFAKIAKVPEGTTPSADWLKDYEEAEWEWIDTNYFLFSDREPGLYAVGIGHMGGELIAFTTVELTGGIERIELRQPADDDSDYLRLIALEPDGLPARTLSVSAVSSGPDGPDWREPETLRKPDGSHWVRYDDLAAFDLSSWPNGATIKLTLQSPRFGSKSVDLLPGQKEIQVQFEAPHALTVLVRGDGTDGAAVGLSRQADDEPTPMLRYWRGSSDDQFESVEDGQVRFARLAPGTWELTLYNDSSIQLAKQTVQMGSTDMQIELTAPPTYELVIHIPGAVESSGVQIARLDASGQPDGGTEAYAQVESDDRARFKGLPAGSYRLMSWDGSGSITVTVPSGEVLFQIEPLDCLMIAISDAEGRLAKAGFRAGDRITAVDGTELTPETIWNVGWEGLSKDRAEATVRRGDQTLTIPVEGLGPFLNNPGQLGGSLIPSSRK